MTSLSNFPLKRKRGRPVGSKNKRVRKIAGKEYTFVDKPFKQLNADAARVAKREREMQLLREHAQLLLEQSRLKATILNLEHQAIGYRAVVSYLEHQFITTLGNKK